MKSAQSSLVSVNYWRVFTDAALSMLLILVLFVFAQFLANSRILARLMMEKRQQQFERELRKELGAAQQFISVQVDGNLQRIRFSEAILFDRGDDKVKESGKDVIRPLGARLLAHSDWVSGIQIEGHTDRRPIRNSRFASNWELSSARATSVVRVFHDEIGLDPERHPLAATGRGQYVPLGSPPAEADNVTVEEFYRKNRRVEVVIAYSEQALRSTPPSSTPGFQPTKHGGTP